MGVRWLCAPTCATSGATSAGGIRTCVLWLPRGSPPRGARSSSCPAPTRRRSSSAALAGSSGCSAGITRTSASSPSCTCWSSRPTPHSLQLQAHRCLRSQTHRRLQPQAHLRPPPPSPLHFELEEQLVGGLPPRLASAFSINPQMLAGADERLADYVDRRGHTVAASARHRLLPAGFRQQR